MSQKNQINIHDSGDLPLGSNTNNLQVEKVTDNKTNNESKVRIRKATQVTEKKSKSGKTNTKSNAQTNAKSKTKSKTTLTSSSIDMEDLESLNEKNLKQYRFRSRRNKMIITVLVILLTISLTIISTYAIVTRLENNCWLYVSGANAKYVVDGKERNKFRCPQAISGNRTYVLNVDLKIQSDSYNIRFKVEIYQNELLLENTLLDYDQDYFRRGNDGFYYSINKMSGTVDLFDRVIIDSAYENTLNISNFRMEVTTILF